MTFELKITFDSDTKDVSVTGPTDDIGLCLLMADLARQSLYAHVMQKASERRVVPPNGFQVPKTQ